MNHGLHRTRGFTLIELMIALVLGLIVIGGVISVLLSNQQSYRTNQALSQVQDGSRVAFEFLSRDIRQAGLTGCGATPTLALNGGAQWWNTWTSNLVGYDNTDASPAITFGTALNQRVNNTDAIAALGASFNAFSVNANGSGADANTFVLNEQTNNLSAGDVAILCDSASNSALILQITGVSGQTISHSSTGATPGNNASAAYTANNNSALTKLDATTWYIGNNALGQCSAATPQACSLFRATLVNNGGTASVQDQEIVRNVTNMQLAYLQGGTSFVPATSVTDWSQVTAVRVTLTVNVPTNPNNATNPEFVQRTYTNTIALRNRVG